MASISKRGDTWTARIRRRGYPPQVRTFRTKGLAAQWAREVEARMDAAAFVPNARAAERTTLDEALDQYARQVTPRKRSHRPELLRIAAIRRHDISKRLLATVRAQDVAAYRDHLAERGLAPATIRLHLAVLSHLFSVAAREWGMEGLHNPVRSIAKPSAAGSARTRRLHDGELDKLTGAANAPAWFAPLVRLAIETGMRRAEMAGLRDAAIMGIVAHLAKTKNGDARDVPLSPAAQAALAELRALQGALRMPSTQAMTRAFTAACKAAGIKGLRFHDLRREATSRFFERGLALPEVAAITGHRTWAMLKRYTVPRAADLAKKLAAQGGQEDAFSIPGGRNPAAPV